MEARKVEQPEEATYVDYKDFVRDLFAEAKTKPNPTFVLKGLLERYVKNSAVPYKLPSYLGGLAVKNRDFTHTADAKLLLSLSDDISWLHDTLTKVGAAKFTDAINKGSDFGLMLIPFFKAYPEFIHYLQNEAARKKVLEEVKLCPGAGVFAEWQSSFKQNHIDGKCSDDYEVLSQYAEQIPKSMTVDYATFLLKQLRSKGTFPNEPEESAQRPEEYPGIYAGWVCVALSKLVDKLDAKQKKDVCGYLLKELDKTELKSLTNIGLCLALSTLATDADTKAKTVERLHKFVGDQLRNKQTGIDLAIEFQSEVSSVRNYMPLLFQAMFNLGIESKNQSKALVLEILLDAQYLYAYREGLNILFDWLEPRDLEAFYEVLSHDSASGVQVHPNFVDIIPLFWPRMITNPKGVKISGVVDNTYIREYQAALAELTNPNAYTKWTRCHNLVASGKAWTNDINTVLAQIKALIRALPSFHKTAKEHLIPEVLRGLSTYMLSMPAHEKAEYSKMICDNFLPFSCSKLGLNFAALQSILTFRSNSEQDLDTIFRLMLTVLKKQHTQLRQYMAGDAVTMPSAALINEIFTEVGKQAARLSIEKIPALMLFLETLGTTGEPIVDEKMHLVLGDILKPYPAKIKEFIAQMAPVPEPVAPTPSPNGSGGKAE